MNTSVSRGQLAKVLGVECWRIRRLFENGTLPDPGRIGLARAIPSEQVPAIVDALRAKGWLPQSAQPMEEAAHHA